MSFSKRIQFYFPEDLLKDLKSLADLESKPLAEIVRNASKDYINKTKNITKKPDPLWNIVGAFEGDECNLSEEHDLILYGGKR